MDSVAITGASGYVGSHLLKKIANLDNVSIRALTRQKITSPTNTLKFIRGDITDQQALISLLEPDTTVINLAFSNQFNERDAIQVTANFVDICTKRGVKRVIHCSSISVYGRVDGVVTERTSCIPVDEYGKVKRAIEETLIEKAFGKLEVIVL